jgi:uncharacterized protein (TIGR02145 family)
MCHNLASANTSADPFTPSWEINGGYWQWGRIGSNASLWLNTNTANFAHGPTGPDSTQANEGAISDWSTIYAPNGSWQDGTKTADDPCPTGYRVPTKAQWELVMSFNTGSNVGNNWTSTATNYSTGRSFGPALMLPAAGGRSIYDGELSGRGDLGYYWSSTEGGAGTAWSLVFDSGAVITFNYGRSYGFSIRCAAE